MLAVGTACCRAWCYIQACHVSQTNNSSRSWQCSQHNHHHGHSTLAAMLRVHRRLPFGKPCASASTGTCLHARSVPVCTLAAHVRVGAAATAVYGCACLHCNIRLQRQNHWHTAQAVTWLLHALL